MNIGKYRSQTKVIKKFAEEAFKNSDLPKNIKFSVKFLKKYMSHGISINDGKFKHTYYVDLLDERDEVIKEVVSKAIESLVLVQSSCENYES